MKLANRKRIEEFVEAILHEASARKITDEWPLEHKEISRVLVDHFKVMGIYYVEPMAGSQLIEKNAIRVLRTSPELQEMIRKQKQIQESGRRAKAIEA